MRTIAVVPALNESGRIGQVVARLKKMVDEVVVVDDGSSDATSVEARQAGAVVLRHAINRGQGAALRTGTAAALRLGADCVVHIDADGQHDPSYLPALVGPVAEGRADAVLGSRFLGEKPEGMPLSRRALLKLALIFNRFVLGIPSRLTDPQSGLRALSADCAAKLDFHQDRMAHCSEILRLLSRAPWRTIEIPVKVNYTAETLRKGQKASDALKIVWQLIVGSII